MASAMLARLPKVLAVSGVTGNSLCMSGILGGCRSVEGASRHEGTALIDPVRIIGGRCRLL
ncbi:hypothetical protein, partial [Pandoraea sputorum]|uniref:hypothetical protein n=1 Tax=Pandoraea sputorum TaxID=93222 RepID=UPI003557ABD3